MTSKSVTLCCLLVLAGGVPTRQAASEAPSASVRIKSSKGHHLRGEPVVLKVTITNNGKIDIPVWVDLLKYQITFFIKRDGEKFMRVDVAGDAGKRDVHPSVKPLPPEKSKLYEFRILPNFVHGKVTGLVFDKPGSYHLKVRYPVWNKSTKRTVKFESNTIQLQIHEPKGVDAKVFAEISERDFWYFFRFGKSSYRRKEGKEPPVVKAARLSKEYPSSKYRPALHWVLQKYTQDNPRWFKFKHLKPEEVQLIKEALAAGGKIEKTSRFSPAVGIGFAVLLASVVTVLIARKPSNS